MVRETKDKQDPLKFVKSQNKDRPYCMQNYPEARAGSDDLDNQLRVLNESLAQFRAVVDAKTTGAERYASRTRNAMLAAQSDEIRRAKDIEERGNYLRFRPDLNGCGRREWDSREFGTPTTNPVADPTPGEVRSDGWDRGMVMAEDNGRLLSCASPEDPKFKAYVRDMGDGPSNPYRGINELTEGATDLPVNERGRPQSLSQVFLDSQFCLGQTTADDCGSADPKPYPLSQEKTVPAHRCSWIHPNTAHQMCVPNAVKYKMRPSDRPGTFNPDDGYTKWFENRSKLFVGHLQHEQEKYNRAVNYKGYGINGRYVAPMISEETLGKRR